MPNPNELDNASIIASIASQARGGATADQQPAAPQTGQPPAPPPAPKASDAPTSMEKAQAKISPKDAQQEEAVTNFLKIGDREYTQQQLEGTMARYKDLNYKWQSHKPVVDVIESLTKMARESGHDPKPDEIAGLVDAAVRAYVKDPQFGGQKQGDGKGKDGAAKAPMSDSDEAEGPNDPDAMYEQWEKENAVKLPPGFKETAKSQKDMSAKLDQMMTMFQQIVQGGMAGQQATEQAGQTMQQAQTMQADAATSMITNNLNRGFQQAGINLDAQGRADFRMFAAQRGYDFPDFMDAGLTATVIADYKANKDAPEVQRLREIASKRQAFTGMVEGSPGSAGAAPAAAQSDPMLDSLISSAMSKRNM
jgi:hypothetical protein